MNDEMRRLKRRGVSDEDIRSAQAHQEAQRRTGQPVLRLGVIIGVDSPGPKAADPEVFRNRQLRGKSPLAQAAILVRHAALTEKDPSTKCGILKLANELGLHAKLSNQGTFDFVGGNVSIAHQYQDMIGQRLRASGATLAQRNAALAVLWTMTRHLKWQSFDVDITAVDLSEQMGMGKSEMSQVLKLLESVGAIAQFKKGRKNNITITPEGVYRGPIDMHSTIVERYRLSVIEGGRRDAESRPEAVQIDLEEAIAARRLETP